MKNEKVVTNIKFLFLRKKLVFYLYASNTFIVFYFSYF